LIPGIQQLPYASRKPKTTPTGVVVSLAEEAILATLEDPEEVVEDGDEPPIFRHGERDTLIILASNFGIGGRGEGNKGGRGRDEPTDSEPGPSDSKEEEEDEEEEEMANQNLKWMTQGTLALPGALHKTPKRAERMSI